MQIMKSLMFEIYLHNFAIGNITRAKRFCTKTVQAPTPLKYFLFFLKCVFTKASKLCELDQLCPALVLL